MRKFSLHYIGLVVLLTAAAAWSQSSAVSGQQLLAPGYRLRPANLTRRGRQAMQADPAHAEGAAYSSYTISTADFPGSDGTEALDTANGVLIGNFQDPLNSGASTAFTMKGNVAQQLTVTGFQGVIALSAINSTGEMVGEATTSPIDIHSVSIISGQATVFSPPQAIADTATGVNAGGTIVGCYFDGSGSYGYIYRGGQFTTIAYPRTSSTSAMDINKFGAIVGYYSSPGGFSGFLLKKGKYTSIDVPQATTTKPTGINDKGEIAGSYIDANSFTHGFLYSNGVFQTFDVPGASGTSIARVMNNGELVGWYSDDENELHAFTAH